MERVVTVVVAKERGRERVTGVKGNMVEGGVTEPKAAKEAKGIRRGNENGRAVSEQKVRCMYRIYHIHMRACIACVGVGQT
jgi:hypothetical protein